MSSTSLYRFSGISLVLGSVLAVGGAVLGIFSSDPTSTITGIGAIIAFVGATVGILGMPGMYAKQAQRAGVLGLIGTTLLVCYFLILGIFGNALNALILPFIAAHTPLLAKTEPPALGIFYQLGGLLGVVGGILLGIATIRAAILPRWAGVVLMVGVVIQFVGDFLRSPLANLGFLLVMIALAWLGLSVISLSSRATPASSELPQSAVRV